MYIRLHYVASLICVWYFRTWFAGRPGSHTDTHSLIQEWIRDGIATVHEEKDASAMSHLHGHRSEKLHHLETEISRNRLTDKIIGEGAKRECSFRFRFGQIRAVFRVAR